MEVCPVCKKPVTSQESSQILSYDPEERIHWDCLLDAIAIARREMLLDEVGRDVVPAEYIRLTNDEDLHIWAQFENGEALLEDVRTWSKYQLFFREPPTSLAKEIFAMCSTDVSTTEAEILAWLACVPGAEIERADAQALAVEFVKAFNADDEGADYLD